MPGKKRRDSFSATISGLLFLLAGFLKMITPATGIISNFVFVFGNIVFLAVIFAWGIYVERSILSRKIRSLMLWVVFFMIIYILTGVAKHRIFLDGNYAGRYLWYLYYLPQIFATYLTFVITFRVGKPEEYKLPALLKMMFAVGAIIVIGYLTNDYHQLAFRFAPDFVAWDQHYGWGPLFYISTLWIYLWLIAGVILLSIKCISINKKKAWIPIFWLLLGSAYIVCVYFLDLWENDPFNLPEAHCFIVIAMLESSIRIGTLPSNRAYGEIVSKSSAAFQIANYDNKVIYRSDNAVPLQPQQMDLAKKKNSFIDKNTLLLSHAVSGGFVFWTEDFTALNEMNETLSQINQSLSEERDLLRAENELREQRAKIAEQTRLYDEISELVKPQLEKISCLLDDYGDFNRSMATICVLNCYVKRRANLTLLKAKKAFFSSDELFLSLKESSEYIRLYGGTSQVYAEGSQSLSSEIILLAFDLWQSVLEALLPELHAITAKISFDGYGNLVFRISADSPLPFEIRSDYQCNASAMGISLDSQWEDETLFITLMPGKGGERL